jgi:hypothetical protein
MTYVNRNKQLSQSQNCIMELVLARLGYFEIRMKVKIQLTYSILFFLNDIQNCMGKTTWFSCIQPEFKANDSIFTG